MLWPLAMVITLAIMMVGASIPYMVKNKFTKKEWVLFGLLAVGGISLNLILSLQGKLPDPLKGLEWLVHLFN
ncbi:hypothetical protein [Halalkalibacter oceani]|uniref:Uncharacterized protein n=1 Tax=Halalkalibacter oceani TaxID=1653776 RepID=A0A9X2DSY3_9BACI|nr:hypothetical protein [Halalkalibacter oceani]MCM3714703.1 hypothetical protein [Halalkalibacter oceani]